MNAERIRKMKIGGDASSYAEDTICFFLQEIAAQLAELNNRMEPGNLIVNVYITGDGTRP
jgi:hypothetical protein